MKYSFALFLFSLAAASCPAATLQFSGLDTNAAAFNQVASYDVGGYRFTSIGGHLGAWTTASAGTFVPGVGNNPQGGTPNVSLSDFDNGGLITMSQVSGGNFSVFGLEIAQWGAYPPDSAVSLVTVTFKGYDAADQLIGSSNCSFTPLAASAPSLSPCSLSGLNNLAYLQVEQGGHNAGTAFQFTDVNVESTAPEPATWSLLLGCIGLAAFGRARRRLGLQLGRGNN